MSSGFFDELERQLIEAAETPLSAGATLRGRRFSRRSQLHSLRLRARTTRAFRLTVAVPALAATLIVAAVAVVGTLDSEHESQRRTLSASREQPSLDRFKAITKAIDASWEGRACSGCYLTDEATLRGQALGSLRPVDGSLRPVRGSLRPVRSIAVHVGGENLRRICVWLIAPDGRAAEGSTCSTNALLAIGGTHSREDAVLTQGFGSSSEEVALAGGT